MVINNNDRCSGLRDLFEDVGGVMVLAATMLFLSGCRGGHNAGPQNDTNTGIPATYANASQDQQLQRVLRADAIAFLQSMATSTYAGYRANAIEALADEPEVGESAARTGLLDQNEGVRFTSAMVIGLKRYKDSAPLVHALLKDESESVRAASIFALARNGYEANLTVLGEYLRSPHLSARSNAALAIGELGDPSAVEMLREALTETNPRATVSQQRLSNLQIAEAMAKLGDDAALSRIRAHLRGTPDEGEAAALAATMLGNLNARVYIQDLKNIVAAWKEYKYSAEVRLASMGALVRMGEVVPVELPLEYFSDEYADTKPGEFQAVREQATYILGLIGGPKALPYLAQSFYESDEEPVRLQAAAAIIRDIALNPP